MSAAAATASAQTPATQASPIPATDLMTRWGKAVTPDNAWRSYPRPQLKRARWQNLHGPWDDALAPKAPPLPPRTDRTLLVPLPLAQKLSRHPPKATPHHRHCYTRDFTLHAI